MLLKLLLLLVVLAPVPAPPRPDPLGAGYFGVKAGLDAGDSDLTLTAVLPGTPAAAAGLRPGDTLARVGPLAPKRFAEVQAYVSNLRPGTVLRLEVVRGDRPVGLTITVGALPAGVALADPFDDRLRVVPVVPPNR